VSATGVPARGPVLERPEAEPTAAERAIVRTTAYAAMFQAPLTLAELHRALVEVPLDFEALLFHLDRPFVRERVAVTDGFVHMRGQEACVALRRHRQEHTRALLARHAGALRAVAAFPFVRLAAVSGACAHDNAADDDVDVFLVVKKNRAWSVYLGLVLLSRWRGVRQTLCLNYLLDENNLALTQRDLFTAAEIVGMRPLAGGETYRRFLEANAWVAARHPNFFAAHPSESMALPEAGGRPWIERLLDLGPAPLLEALSRLVFGAYLRRKARGRSGVVLAAGCLKLHTQDHAPHLNATFAHRLAALEERPGCAS
jgi:hypothetical protein